MRLGDDVLVPVSAARASGEALYSLDRSDVLPLLEYSEDSGLGRITRALFKGLFSALSSRSPHPAASVVFTAHDALLLKRMALDGRGLAWLPRNLASEELAQGSLVTAGGEPWQVPVEIRLYRQPTELAPVAERLWAVATQSS